MKRLARRGAALVLALTLAACGLKGDPSPPEPDAVAAERGPPAGADDPRDPET